MRGKVDLWYRQYDGRGQPKAPDLSRPWAVLVYEWAPDARWGEGPVGVLEIAAATPNELAAALDAAGLVVPRLDLLQLWCERWYGPALGRWQEEANHAGK